MKKQPNRKYTDQERDELLQEFVEVWGEDSQRMMAIEEMAELTKELCKTLRHREKGDEGKLEENRHDTCGEIADVLITVGQMRRIYGAEEVDEIINCKLNRGAKRLEEWRKEHGK